MNDPQTTESLVVTEASTQEQPVAVLETVQTPVAEGEALVPPTLVVAVSPEASVAAQPQAPPEPVAAEAEAVSAPEAEEAIATESAEEPATNGKVVEAPPAPEPSKKRWYVVKVQSGREESIKEAIERRVKIEGLQDLFGQIIIPVERVTEMNKQNKRVVKERKLYPGYLMVEVEYNDQILYLFRETSGVGDFVGGSVTRAPTPMSQREIDKIRVQTGSTQQGPEKPVKPKLEPGERVKIKEGTFKDMEGEVKEVFEAREKGTFMVKVEVTIWGRPVSVELEHWQVEIE